MSEHESIRELLALAAAGVLSTEEERRVRNHASACEQCAADLQAWGRLSQALERMPVPQGPPGLAERTCSRVLDELAAAAERRWDDAVLAFLTLFAWTVGLAGWAVVRLFNRGLLVVFDQEFTLTFTWLAGSTVLVWLTAGVAAVMLSHRRQGARRSL